jgi:tetratricopeptide (TPR) repeat protein
MRSDSVVFGIAGIFFGVLVGWIIGSQRATVVAPQAATAAPAAGSTTGQSAPTFDEARAAQLKTAADRSPNDSDTRVQLGNLYFDAERYDEAARWYEQALKINPKDVNASTDLGIAYYYSNQPDRALAQFDRSLQIDPRHAKTLFNIGIVRARGKEDLQGAINAWSKVIEVAPDSDEAKVARQMLDAIRTGHQSAGAPGAGK